VYRSAYAALKGVVRASDVFVIDDEGLLAYVGSRCVDGIAGMQGDAVMSSSVLYMSIVRLID
jgi:hypothetical protein